MVPQNLPVLTAQVGWAGGTTIEVVGTALVLLVVGVDVIFEVDFEVMVEDLEVVSEVLEVEDVWEVDEVLGVVVEEVEGIVDEEVLVVDTEFVVLDFEEVVEEVVVDVVPTPPLGVRYQFASGS